MSAARGPRSCLVWELGEWDHGLLSFKCPSEEHPITMGDVATLGMSLLQTGGLGLWPCTSLCMADNGGAGGRGKQAVG